MFDYLIITHLPVFYKVNLYNEISKHLNVHVIFIGGDTNEKRSTDFNVLGQSNFSYTLLHEGSFQTRNRLKTCVSLVNVMKKLKFNKVIVGGWDLPEFWLAMLVSKKRNNCLALESTVLDSPSEGLKGLVKKCFLARCSSVFASGQLHIELLNKLNYTGNIKKTLGVGIVNNIATSLSLDASKRQYSRRFLFIGRLTRVKNLMAIVNVFYSLPDFHLTVIGTGEDEDALKSIASSNVDFKGSIDNSALGHHFANHDFLLLPSLQEPWGLVVEESLFNNTPVVISDRCGSVELIDEGQNGLVFSPIDETELKSLLTSIDQDLFVRLVEGATDYSINHKDAYQVKQYVDLVCQESLS